MHHLNPKNNEKKAKNNQESTKTTSDAATGVKTGKKEASHTFKWSQKSSNIHFLHHHPQGQKKKKNSKSRLAKTLSMKKKSWDLLKKRKKRLFSGLKKQSKQGKKQIHLR